MQVASFVLYILWLLGSVTQTTCFTTPLLCLPFLAVCSFSNSLDLSLHNNLHNNLLAKIYPLFLSSVCMSVMAHFQVFKILLLHITTKFCIPPPVLQYMIFAFISTGTLALNLRITVMLQVCLCQ